jgi:hypothetical protein
MVYTGMVREVDERGEACRTCSEHQYSYSSYIDLILFMSNLPFYSHGVLHDAVSDAGDL